MKKLLTFSALALLLLVQMSAPVFAVPVKFISSMPTVGVQSWAGPLAETFTVGTQPIKLLEAGVFDSEQLGLNLPITWELWTGGATNATGSHTFVTSIFFSTGPVGTLDGQHRFLDLPDITLTAGQTYTVLAWGYGGSEPNYNENVVGNYSDVSFSTIGLVAGLAGYGGNTPAQQNPDTFIWSSDLTSWNFGVATFKYEVVPEPATMLLLGSGLIGLAGFRKKNKRLI